MKNLPEQRMSEKRMLERGKIADSGGDAAAHIAAAALTKGDAAKKVPRPEPGVLRLNAW
jgi:hypothetical protein